MPGISYTSDRWGHITLLRTYRAPLYLKGPDGKPYVADTHGGPRMWLLHCACGFDWEIEEKNFPGRRVLRSCGRPECTAIVEPPKPPKKIREARSAVSAYLPLDLQTEVRTYQLRHGITFSKALENLIREGLVTQLING